MTSLKSWLEDVHFEVLLKGATVLPLELLEAVKQRVDAFKLQLQPIDERNRQALWQQEQEKQAAQQREAEQRKQVELQREAEQRKQAEALEQKRQAEEKDGLGMICACLALAAIVIIPIGLTEAVVRWGGATRPAAQQVEQVR